MDPFGHNRLLKINRSSILHGEHIKESKSKESKNIILKHVMLFHRLFP